MCIVAFVREMSMLLGLSKCNVLRTKSCYWLNANIFLIGFVGLASSAKSTAVPQRTFIRAFVKVGDKVPVTYVKGE